MSDFDFVDLPPEAFVETNIIAWRLLGVYDSLLFSPFRSNLSLVYDGSHWHPIVSPFNPYVPPFSISFSDYECSYVVQKQELKSLSSMQIHDDFFNHKHFESAVYNTDVVYTYLGLNSISEKQARKMLTNPQDSTCGFYFYRDLKRTLNYYPQALELSSIKNLALYDPYNMTPRDLREYFRPFYFCNENHAYPLIDILVGPVFNVVVGACLLSGVVLEHDLGYRCSEFQILGLYSPLPSNTRRVMSKNLGYSIQPLQRAHQYSAFLKRQQKEG